MGETLHGPAVIAAIIRAAFEEGAAVERSSTPIAEQWDSSKAKARAAQIIANAGEPTKAERLLGLFREWANTSPDGTTPEMAWKRASGLMRQMRELIGDAPFDIDTRRPREGTDGGNR